MSYSNYQKGAFYEMLIKKMYSMSGSSPKGADLTLMRNLLDAEDGDRLPFLKRAEKQFDTVKNYLEKAFDQGVKSKRVTTEQFNQFRRLKIKLDQASSGADLYEVVAEALEIE